MFVAALALFREEGPARAYGIALAAAAFLFFVPYALVLSYPQFDAVTRRNDAAIAGASLLLLLAAWGLAAGF
jgi:hypothetical protein